MEPDPTTPGGPTDGSSSSSPPPGTAPLPPPREEFSCSPPPGGTTFVPPISERDVRTYSMLCHLAALAQLIVPIPSLGAIAGPLVVWLIKRNDHPTIDQNGKESLNFQLSMLIYAWALWLIGVPTTFILVGFLFLAAGFIVWVIALVLAVVAAVKVSQGESYHYPMTIRFLS